MRRVTLTLIVISFLCIININLVFSEAPQSKEMPGDFGDSCDTGGVFDLTGVSCDESCNGQTNTCPDGHTQTCSCYMCVGACMDDLGCGIDPICGFCSSGTCTGEGELYGCTWGSCTGPTQTFCGDGTIQSPNDYGTYEDCEGINLNGASCVSLGYDSGTLSCTSLTCTFDESGCSYDSSEDCTDGVDNDADGDVDCDDSDCSGDASCPCTDNDGDGACAEDYDCDDTNADISPYETEICNDGLDNDCDSYIDCQDRYCSSDITCTCEDADSDGYYAIEDSCYEGLDCDDTNITINPSAIELCVDLIDNDCDNLTDCEDINDCNYVQYGEAVNNQICLDGNATTIPYNPAAAPNPIMEAFYYVNTYNDFLTMLNMGTVITSTGNDCNAECASWGMTCGFAEAGQMTCDQNSTTKCTRYLI